MEILWKSLGALVAIVGFGVVLKVPERFLFWAGVNASIGWMVYLLMEAKGISMLFSTFAGAMVISIAGHLFARIFKTPVTMFVIPANLTLVPGAGMYRTVYYAIQSDNVMCAYYLQQTLLAAGTIAAAIFIVNIIMGNFISGIHVIRKKLQRQES